MVYRRRLEEWLLESIPTLCSYTNIRLLVEARTNWDRIVRRLVRLVEETVTMAGFVLVGLVRLL